MQTVTDNIYILVLTAMLGTALLVVSFILLQIRNQNKLLRGKKKLHDAEIEYQKELLLAVITSQEQERKRIGMDLHDEVGSTLSSLRMMIESHNDKLAQALPGDTFTEQSKSSIDGIITNVRRITHNLAPRITDSLSLLDGLYDLGDHVNAAGKLHMELNADEQHMNIEINSNTALALYRVIAELVNNTLKHANAQKITLHITTETNALHFSYTDDGIGLPADHARTSKGMGMQNIASRLNIIKASYRLLYEAKGFAIQIILPLDQNTYESNPDRIGR